MLFIVMIDNMKAWMIAQMKAQITVIEAKMKMMCRASWKESVLEGEEKA